MEPTPTTTIANDWRGWCYWCGELVPWLGAYDAVIGGMRRSVHPVCHRKGEARVRGESNLTGHWVENVRGRCRFAPACGCCAP